MSYINNNNNNQSDQKIEYLGYFKINDGGEDMDLGKVKLHSNCHLEILRNKKGDELTSQLLFTDLEECSS